MQSIFNGLVNFLVNTCFLPNDLSERIVGVFLLFVFYFLVFRLPVAIFNKTSDRKMATAKVDLFVFLTAVTFVNAPMIVGILA